jgi:hypothetical protein
MKRTFALLLPLFACVAAAPVSIPAPGVNEVIAEYARMHRVTKQRYVPGGIPIQLICGGTLETREISAKKGPHAFHAIHVFMNNAAQEAFVKSSPYPVGSVIVKEKDTGGETTLHAALGGMIKRKASIPPSVGDWEFFYSDWHQKVSPAKELQTCADCHANAAKNDFVFGDWAKPMKATLKEPK